MSLYIAKSSFFQRCPRVWQDDSNLYAQTSRWYQFLNLCSYCRQVRVSKIDRQIIIRIRKFWFFSKTTTIPFDKIEFIERYHWDVAKGNAYTLKQDGWGATRVTEVWYVRVFANGYELPINLFRFIGRASRMTSWLEVIFPGFPLADIEGSQDSKSETYAKLVAEYTGSEYRL